MIEQIIEAMFSNLAGEVIRWGIISVIAIYFAIFLDRQSDSESPGCLGWLLVGLGFFVFAKGKETWFMATVYIIVLVIITIFLSRCLNKFTNYIIAKGKENTFKKKKKTAEKGADSNSYYELAKIYEKGDGVKRSLKQAEKWYRKAAEYGDAAMKREFGKRFEKGDHIAREVDMEEAQRWYEAADKWEKKHNKK